MHYTDFLIQFLQTPIWFHYPIFAYKEIKNLGDLGILYIHLMQGHKTVSGGARDQNQPAGPSDAEKEVILTLFLPKLNKLWKPLAESVN